MSGSWSAVQGGVDVVGAPGAQPHGAGVELYGCDRFHPVIVPEPAANSQTGTETPTPPRVWAP